jgi:hypothetical protein
MRAIFINLCDALASLISLLLGGSLESDNPENRITRAEAYEHSHEGAVVL